ncbi:hypothetical protein [Mucilaginibacter aquatilis]|uniref:Uncharacterized protein n=1 Tax=Mucilaginibacter aquatilis TaxID=1517760 RepID=A0A6I4IDT3_9SPHI|nr:hypothetical protein [Mucilaginibacter aquatilis]MVN91756.1 hypothetical protein [Mucilaginibacter aquatilis]
MLNLKTITVIIALAMIQACSTKPPKSAKPEIKPAVRDTSLTNKEIVKKRHEGDFAFVKYIDDGDYSQLIASEDKSSRSFINDADTTRSLNRGDLVKITWKDGTITMAGDDDAEVPAKLLIAVAKTGDGPVSKFRKLYPKKIKYTWATTEDYTSSYLDRLYLSAEYYLATTQNPLLRQAISNKQDITYSIEPQEKNGKSYTMLGIAPVGPNGSNVVQWLYIGDEDDKLYEYDLANDHLVEYK